MLLFRPYHPKKNKLLNISQIKKKLKMSKLKLIKTKVELVIN